MDVRKCALTTAPKLHFRSPFADEYGMSSEAGVGGGCQIGVRDGALVIEPATGEGAPCKVVLGDGVRMVVDGRPVHERCEILGSEVIELDLGDHPAENLVEVTFDPLELEASVAVKGSTGTAHAMMDQPPSAGLTIWREVVSHTPPPPLQPRDVSAALSGAGVHRGVMAREIAQLIANPYAAPVVVARGTPPGESTDAVVTRERLEESQHSPFFCVRAGALLATKTPAQIGAAGMSVKGQPVHARTPSDPDLVAGEGVELVIDDDGVNRLYALRDGRPVYDGGTVSVATTIQYVGDIDVGTGDVTVYGSLSITGGVGEERKVWASGTLDISGGIEGAEIEALGGVTLRGPVLHSKVHAGSRNSVYRDLAGHLAPCRDDLARLVTESVAIHDISQQRGQTQAYTTVVRSLVEQRYLHVREALRNALEVVTRAGDMYFGDQLHGDLETAVGISQGLRDYLSAAPRTFTRACAHIDNAVGVALDTPSPVTSVHYLQSSELECAGDLVLTGQGVFTSDVVVGGDFTSAGHRSTIRGGVTSVGGIMRVNELGAAGSARTVVRLPGHTKIADRLTAQRVHPGVRVEIQDIEVVFQYERNAVAVGVDDDGTVVWGG